MRHRLEHLLERRGYQVELVADGLEAFEVLQRAVPDLIVLDINMPRMEGYKVCEMVRNASATCHVPVVMLSTNEGFLDRVLGRIAGVSDYLTKPWQPEMLVRTIEHRLVTPTEGRLLSGPPS